jgi:rhodanese-related sulfurtransferase
MQNKSLRLLLLTLFITGLLSLAMTISIFDATGTEITIKNSGDKVITILLIATPALLSIIYFLPGFLNRQRHNIMMSTLSLKQKLDANEDLLIIDVRPFEDFTYNKIGRIRSAKNIELEELLNRLNEINDRLHKPIALICTKDTLSSKAAKLLKDKGFKDLYVVKGGMVDWNKKGYPVN